MSAAKEGLKLATRFVNRNPRNLEMLGLQRKRSGWQLEKHSHLKHFIYKVELLEGKSAQVGRLTHHEDGLVIQASSAEPEIAAQLYSRTDTCAAANIGRVLAQRCLQSGVHFALPAASEEKRQSSQHQGAFFAALEDGGLVLREPEAVQHDGAVDPHFGWRTYPLKHNRQDKLDEL